MKLNKLKVRPKKDAAAAPCAAEFATMLACWASSNDLNNIGACKDSARALQECMASRVSFVAPIIGSTDSKLMGQK